MALYIDIYRFELMVLTVMICGKVLMLRLTGRIPTNGDQVYLIST